MRRLNHLSFPIGYALAVTEILLAFVIGSGGSIAAEYMHQQGVPRQVVAAALLGAAVLLIAEPRRDWTFVAASMVYIWVCLQTLFVAIQTHVGFAGPVFAAFSLVQMYTIFGEQRRRCSDD